MSLPKPTDRLFGDTRVIIRNPGGSLSRPATGPPERSGITTVRPPSPEEFTEGPWSKAPQPDIPEVGPHQREEFGANVAYIDAPYSRNKILDPSGIRGKTIPLEGPYKIGFLNDMINRVKEILNSPVTQWERTVSGIAKLRSIYSNQGANIESVLTRSLEAFKGDLQAVQQNSESIALHEIAQRAHRLGFADSSGAWGGDGALGGAVNPQANDILNQVATTGGVPSNITRPGINSQYGLNLNDGQVDPVAVINAMSNVAPRINLDKVPTGMLPQLGLGIPPIDFSSKQAFLRHYANLNRLTKEVLDTAAILYPDPPKHELSLGYILSSEVNGFRTYSPEVTSICSQAVMWLEQEFVVDGFTVPGLARPLQVHELIRRFPVEFGTVVGWMLFQHNALPTPMLPRAVDQISKSVLQAKNAFLSLITDGRLRSVYVGTYSYDRDQAEMRRASRGRTKLLENYL